MSKPTTREAIERKTAEGDPVAPKAVKLTELC
jgi:hypothetical protein